jgi:hypothetical protein
MDCKAARLLLAFPQTGPDAPTGDEATELRDHLAVCPECDAAFRAEARVDAHIGRAMRDVPVPTGLKEQLLKRLAEERVEAWRKRLLQAVRGVAAAAAVLIAVGVGLGLWNLLRGREINVTDVHIAWNVARPMNAEGVEAEFQAMGYRNCAPDFVNYTSPKAAFMIGEGPVPGYPDRKAPRMMFVGPRGEHAVLIGINERQYKVPEYTPEDGYKYRVEVVRTGRWAWVVLYTGDNWDWLRAPPE